MLKPRGTCSVCGRNVAILKDGVLGKHLPRIPRESWGPSCHGSHLFPKEAADAKPRPA